MASQIYKNIKTELDRLMELINYLEDENHELKENNEELVQDLKFYLDENQGLQDKITLFEKRIAELEANKSLDV